MSGTPSLYLRIQRKELRINFGIFIVALDKGRYITVHLQSITAIKMHCVAFCNLNPSEFLRRYFLQNPVFLISEYVKKQKTAAKRTESFLVPSFMKSIITGILWISCHQSDCLPE